MQKIVFLLTISGLVCCQPSSPLQNQVHRFQNKTTGTAVNMELAVPLLNNSSTEKLPLVPIMDIKPLVPQEEKNSSLNGTTGRNGRQLGVITRGISNQLMEGVDGIDLSSWFSYIKGMWRWMTSGAGGASSESLKVTNEMSSLTSSFIEGQIREIAENQTQILSQLESDERQQVRIQKDLKGEVSSLMYYGSYAVFGFMFLLLAMNILTIYQIRLFKKELSSPI